MRVLTKKGQRGLDDIPNLIEIQLDSYKWFLEHGLRELFRSFSPISDFTENLALSFHDYQLGEPKYPLDECRDRDLTYEAPLKVRVSLLNKSTGETVESDVFLGELALMTEKGTFVINGAERVVVSQLARSPGIYFRDTIDITGRSLFSAQVIPSEGAWLEFDTDSHDVISVRIGQAHKFPATTLLRALHGINLTPRSSQLRCSTDEDLLRLLGREEKLSRPKAEDLEGKWLVDAFTRGKEVIADRFTRLDADQAARVAAERPREVTVLSVNRLVEATMEKDPTHEEDNALMDIYRRERPGDPVNTDLARQRLRGLFADSRRYDLARVGRYKLNQKLGLELPLTVRTLTKEDLVAIFRYVIRLDEGDPEVLTDEIDHLQNKRVRCVGELLQNQFRLGMLRTERVARERMTSLDPELVTPQAVISTKPISAAIKSFFSSSQLSQFLDQTNPLTELAHKRRLSSLGPGGLSRQSAKLEVRDVHHSHYGRICPIETPEGPNIGLIGALAVHARLDEYGFIETPYRRVKDGIVSKDVVYLTADGEDRFRIAPADARVGEDGRFLDSGVTVRYLNSYPKVKPTDIDFMDLSPRQLVSAATCLIPFLENDDANRALMGSNMQRQAVPLVRPQAPYVKTGIETRVAEDSGAMILARAPGMVHQVTAREIAVQRQDGTLDTYPVLNFTRSNQATCMHQRPAVASGDIVRQGQVLADGPCTDSGVLALGRNILVAFAPWEGFNYEDAIVLSERMVREDVFTSIHIEKYEIEARDTKVGPEEITRDIPNVGEDVLKDLDEDGVVRVGADVRAEDILVGKVAPKGQEELTSEEKLVRAIFGEKAAEMRDTSLRVPHGEKGKVVEIKRFSRIKFQCPKCEFIIDFAKDETKQKCAKCHVNMVRIPGDELDPGVNQRVQVYLAQRRKIMEGDKMAGRHGNKGVVAKILPLADMPYLPDGTPIDIVLNPLGVPSRMNIGQIMETHLGYAAQELGLWFENPIFEGAKQEEILDYLGRTTDRLRRDKAREYLVTEAGLDGNELGGDSSYADFAATLRSHIEAMTAEERDRLGTQLAIAPALWDAATPAVQAGLIAEAVSDRADGRVGLNPRTGKCWAFDGRSGVRFNQQLTVGQIYMMKLVHLVEDKVHARSTGPYSLVTQQPLGGKAQFGGQRFGEMEVWALEAYGAAHTLQEILTIKSDDVQGRVRTYEAIVKGETILEPGIPESFKILIKELQSLGLQVSVESGESELIDLEEPEEERVA
jgi:DNA-directed RNA polymerase subunit beta